MRWTRCVQKLSTYPYEGWQSIACPLYSDTRPEIQTSLTAQRQAVGAKNGRTKDNPIVEK
jgi:hypothetical protein